ncbi:MAG: host specificity protein J [Bacteroidetes bacterium]|jgi:predicted phage tail protein|nr:MAG: host specificity protein J [Bacteroidota bacterium]
MTDKKKIIRGSFGGGRRSAPPPRQPTRTPDTLHSKQFASFLDLISEGEIEGSATASKEGITDRTSTAYRNAYLKDVFLNDTPVLKATASSSSPANSDFNFQNVTFTPRFGTSNQTKVDGVESSSSITPVGVTVTADSPVTRQITNTNVERIKVTVTFPQIQKATNEGDLLGSSVQLKIAVQYNSGGFTDVIEDTVTGRTADAYQKDYSVKITGSFPVDIRVIRVTADSTDTSLINAFQFTQFAEIIDDSNRYLNSAYNLIRIDSQQFSAIPRRKFRIRGIKVRIPGAGASSSGTPTVDSSTGRIVYPSGYIFNGVMGAAVWTSCPAMILLDLLTTERYGFGTHIADSNLDLFSFVTASKFANTLVDDGLGGQEARFSCNVNIQSSSSAFDLINELAGVMRCMPIWSTGSILLAQDSPKTTSFLFSLANISSDGFNYSGSSLKQRHSVISVSYYNMDSQDVDFEVFENTTLSAKIGTVVKQVKAFACTSRGQAQRLAKAIAFSEANESEMVTFTTSMEGGLMVRPGAVIEINDPVRAGVRRSGRLKSVTSTTVVTVDDTENTDLPTTNSPTLSLILPDGTVETKDISDITNGVITVSAAFSQTPNVNTIYLIQNSTVESQKFRVITVEETDSINYTITALSYIDTKYDFIEDGASLPARNVSILDQLQPPPSNLSAVETIVQINNQAVSKIVLSWQPITGVVEYQVNYRYSNGNFISTKVSSPDFEILNSQLGLYEFQVFSYNLSAQLSATSNDLSFNAVGKTALPEDPTGLTMEPVSDLFVRLRFNPATDIDVTHGGSISVRHTPSIDPAVATFSNATEIIPKLSGNISETLVPALTGTYLIKFIDDGGRRSNNAARIIVTQPDPQPNQIILTEREDTDSPPFQGNKTRCFYDADFDGLLLDGTLLIDDITQNIDDLSNIDFAGPINSSGTYEFQNVVDMGGIFNLTLKRRFVTSGLLPNDLIDSRTGNIDTWTEFDGTLAEDVNAKLLVSTTELNTTSTFNATYGQSGTTITVTKSAHGYAVGDLVEINFTQGSAVDGEYTIQTVPNVNSFTVTASASTTISIGSSCTFGANFSQFNTFANGEYRARGFKFKVELSSDDPAQNINVSELGYEASLKRRTETVNSAISSQCATNNSAKTVTFDNPFFVGTGSLGGSTTAFLPTIGITLEGAVSGDYFKITSVTGTQFVIETKNSNNDFKDLNFKYTAIGFGKGG